MEPIKPMLLREYVGTDPTGWMISEKLNGFRAILNDGKLFSRNGNLFPAPDWFFDNLPKNTTLDGELYFDKNSLEKTKGIITSGNGWHQIKFYVFDSPNLPVSFSERFAHLENTIVPNHNLALVNHRTCFGRFDVEKFRNEILLAGGEGVVLRNPDSIYEFGCCSKNILKYKSRTVLHGLKLMEQDGELVAAI